MDATTMDTAMDVDAAEAEAREASRQRVAETLASVDRLLATPRDPDVVRRAAEGQREFERRRAEERATEAERLAREYVARPVQKAAPAPAPEPVRYVTRKGFDSAFNGILKAVADQLSGVNNRLVLRFREDERRLDDLEARLAALEGRRDG